MIRPSGKAKKIFESIMKGEEMPKKKQGYKARMDESLGEKHRGKKKQSLKDRRDESMGMDKAMGKRPYASVKSMDRSKKKR